MLFRNFPKNRTLPSAVIFLRSCSRCHLIDIVDQELIALINALFSLLREGFSLCLFFGFSTSSVRFLHHLCAVLSGGGGRDFVLSFLPSSSLPSAAISHPPLPPSIAVPSFFLSIFSLSSSVVVQLPLVHHTLPRRPPLASLYPLQSGCSRFYSGAQLWLSPSPICRPSFLHSSNAPHQGLPHHPSYSLMSSPPCGLHAPTRGSHMTLCPP